MGNITLIFGVWVIECAFFSMTVGHGSPHTLHLERTVKYGLINLFFECGLLGYRKF